MLVEACWKGLERVDQAPADVDALVQDNALCQNLVCLLFVTSSGFSRRSLMCLHVLQPLLTTKRSHCLYMDLPSVLGIGPVSWRGDIDKVEVLLHVWRSWQPQAMYEHGDCFLSL